ncbi:hypothetical protein [Mucilaginibacter sp.]|uniref:hypothetical protein n=1 Tax=Mucilaginibacter sp. TaxID=1882438 RepID=UPI002ED16162
MKTADVLKNKGRDQRKFQAALKPYLVTFYVLCFFTFFYSVFNFRDVLIDYKLPLLLASVFGLIGILFTKSRENYFFAFLGYGSLLVGIPLFINNAFAYNQTIEIKLIINDKHHAAGRHGPSVDVRYDNFDKEINVDDNADLDSSSYIVLHVNKGFLGYYVIRDTKLVKN